MRHILIKSRFFSLSELPFGISELTCDTQVNEGTGLVLPVPLVDGLRVVSPSVTRGRGEDYQLVLQRDGSVSDKRQGQNHSMGLLVRKAN